MSPLYDWECENCGEIWEHTATILHTHLDGCPSCGGWGRKIFTKLTTTYSDRERPWGRSLYRSHDREIENKRRKEGKKI